MNRKLVILLLAILAVVLYANGSREGGDAASGAVADSADAQNFRLPQSLSSAELERLIAERPGDFFLVDVRTPEEFRSGAIPTAVNIPLDVLGSRPPAADRSAPIVLYCRTGSRSGLALRTLQELGYTDVVNFGGIVDWRGEVVRP